VRACSNDQDCDDGIFCNGTERCRGEFGCEVAPSPCSNGDVCDEEADRCGVVDDPVTPDPMPDPDPPIPDPFIEVIGTPQPGAVYSGCAPLPEYCTSLTYAYPAATRGRVLLVGEGDYALRFGCLLRGAGFEVARLLNEEDLNSTVDLSRFRALITLDGTEWSGDEITDTGQGQIVDYVSRGGGFVAVEWALWQNYSVLRDVLPTDYAGWTTGTRQHAVVSFGHPISTGLPVTYSVAQHGYSYGAPRSDATVVIQDEEGKPSLVTRAHGSGRIAWFAAANNYQCFDWLGSAPLSRAFVNAVAWAAGDATMPMIDDAALTHNCRCAGP
jgi:hypothetical protein